MLGRRDPQKALFRGAEAFRDKDLERMGVHARIARQGHEIFTDDDFATLYCEDNGRPSVPPSLLALATLLQYLDGVSDQEAIERTQFDTRWKVALDLDPCTTEAPFAKSTLQLFRARLALHDKEAVAFDASVRMAVESGILPKAKIRLALDSSPVRGRGAVRDTYNLLSDAIKAVLRVVAATTDQAVDQLARDTGLERHVEAASIKGSEDLDWSDPEQVSTFLAGLLEDCRRAIDLARQSGAAAEEAKLLERVIAQDVEPGEGDEPPRIREGVARERVCSATDSEMRCQHGSESKKVVGHKAHIATDVESGIVTAVAVTSPTEPEGAMVAELVVQTEKLGGEGTVETVLGDSAYSSRRATAGAEEVGVQLQTRMPRPPKGRFGPAEFQVSEDRQSATCPAGHPSLKVYHHAKSDTVFHRWDADLCGACPLKAQCTKAALRSLSVPPDFHDRRCREAWAQSGEGRSALRQRISVEHAFARIKNRGGRHARYFGRAKTRLQWLWLAAVTNLLRIWAEDPGQGCSEAGGPAPAPTCSTRTALQPSCSNLRRIPKLAIALTAAWHRLSPNTPAPRRPAYT